jgi:hypothetical protein
MPSAPRIWLDYRPVRIGWVIPDRDVARLVATAAWNSCLWGGRFNPIIPIHEPAVANALVKVFGVDVLIPVEGSPATEVFMDRFPHLHLQRWRRLIFDQQNCEFADICHAVRRIGAQRDQQTQSNLAFPSWDQADELRSLFAVVFGFYTTPDEHVCD